jgi:hypothetical protein
MTYPNESRREEVRERIIEEREGMGMGAIAGIALAAMLFLGIILWAMSSGDRTVATTDSPRIERTTPAPSTTGQGGAAVTPGPAQNTPNPTPPATPPAAR